MNQYLLFFFVQQILTEKYIGKKIKCLNRPKQKKNKKTKNVTLPPLCRIVTATAAIFPLKNYKKIRKN